MQIRTKIVSCHTADSKPVKQEVNGTVILPPLVFPGQTNRIYRQINGQSERPKVINVDRQINIDRHKDKQIGIKINKQANRETNI